MNLFDASFCDQVGSMGFRREHIELSFLILLSTWSFLRPDLEDPQGELREIVFAIYHDVVANTVCQ
jgi:hypothetical protein